MIKFRPERASLSMSIKEEQIFASMEEMVNHVYERCKLVVDYIGSCEPLHTHDIIVGTPCGSDARIGWDNVRTIFVRRNSNLIIVGYCGE